MATIVTVNISTLTLFIECDLEQDTFDGSQPVEAEEIEAFVLDAIKKIEEELAGRFPGLNLRIRMG